MDHLAWTGERLTTSVATFRHGVIEHLHRYALACEVCKNKTVIDIASGEGYGSALISKVAKQVYGVDIDQKSVKHAQDKYESVNSNLKYLEGSTSKIPLADTTVDVVVSFETLEHHKEHEEMMLEIKRVLKPDGLLLISSPEKSIYKERDPNNPFHLKELSFNEFNDLLSRHFKYNSLYQQRFVIGSLISKLSVSNEQFETYDGNYNSITNQLGENEFYNRPFFNICLSSNSELKESIPGVSLFNGVEVVETERKRLTASIFKLKNSRYYKFGSWVGKNFKFLRRLNK